MSILDEFSDIFDGTGKIDGEHDIVVDRTIKPVIHAPQCVP